MWYTGLLTAARMSTGIDQPDNITALKSLTMYIDNVSHVRSYTSYAVQLKGGGGCRVVEF